MRTIDKSEEHRRSARRKQTFRDAFLRNCHELLAMGYARMDAASFQTEEETAITGALVLAMNATLESSDAPLWVAHFVVLDDPPVNAPGRTGKRRRRVDIEVQRSQRGRRPRFQFEAKRLYKSGSVTAYLGSDGLGLFLAGEYAAGHPDAGMLGYVQHGDSLDWAGKIEQRLRGNRRDYRVSEGGDFKRQTLTPTLDSTYCSKHDRVAPADPITIFHALLLFN